MARTYLQANVTMYQLTVLTWDDGNPLGAGAVTSIVVPDSNSAKNHANKNMAKK
jgi:hypothetical protein